MKRTVIAAWTVITHAHEVAAVAALGTVALTAGLMLVLPRVHRGIPASLTAVIVATVLVEVVGLQFARIGALPAHFSAPILPHPDLGHCAPCWGLRSRLPAQR